jgi:hypothetical protein
MDVVLARIPVVALSDREMNHDRFRALVLLGMYQGPRKYGAITTQDLRRELRVDEKEANRLLDWLARNHYIVLMESDTPGRFLFCVCDPGELEDEINRPPSIVLEMAADIAGGRLC